MDAIKVQPPPAADISQYTWRTDQVNDSFRKVVMNLHEINTTHFKQISFDPKVNKQTNSVTVGSLSIKTSLDVRIFC